MRRSLLFLVASFMTGIGALAFSAGVVHAEGHNTIESSSPSAGETITVAPTQLQLRFTLPVGGAESVANMGLSLSCESTLTNLGTPQLSADGVTVSAALTQIPNNGKCIVTWSLPDGSTGSFRFVSNAQATSTIASTTPGATTVPTSASPQTPAVKQRLGGPIGLMRTIVFFFVCALFGGLIFIKLMWPEGVEYGITERYLRQITILGITSIVLLMILTAARQSGDGLVASISPTSWGPLFETNEGRALLIRFVAVCGLGYFAWTPKRIFEETNIVISSILLALTMLSYGFDRLTGRAIFLGVIVAILHMVFVAMWVGSIALLWRVVLYGPGDIDLVHALRGWARIYMPITIGIIVTGVFQVWRIDGISLINSGHGRLVLLKILIVIFLLFIGATVRRFIIRGMQRAQSLNLKVSNRLKRPMGIELSLSIIILAISSWMMSSRPPYILLKNDGPSVNYAIVQDMMGKDDFHVRLSLTPGNVGANSLLVELFGPQRIQNFTITLTPDNPAYSGYSINVPLTRRGAAVLSQDIGMNLKAPGQWNAVINGVTTTGDLEPLTTSFIIADGTTVTTLPKQGLKQLVLTSSTTATTSTVVTTSTTIP